MTFPNGYQGVKKLFTAEILQLICAGCLILTGIAFLIGAGAAAAGSGSGALTLDVFGMIFLIATIVLPLIAYIISLVGLHQAAKDDENFRIAFIFAIIGLVLTVVAGIVNAITGNQGIFDDIFNVLQRICEIIVFIYAVQGIRILALKLEKKALYDQGGKLLTMLTVFFIVVVVLQIINLFFQSGTTIVAAAGILSILAGIFNLVIYVIYLIYLGRAKTMLQDN